MNGTNFNELLGDSRPARYGWAPGNYSIECFKCKKEFTGDKRACMCADCAYSKDEIESQIVHTLKITEKSDETIQRLRGQLQNCVNHLELLKRHAWRSDEDKLNACIEPANKALYETLNT